MAQRRRETQVEAPQQKQDQENEEEDVLKLSNLEGNGVSAGDLQKLREAGLHTVPAVAYSTKKFLLTVRKFVSLECTLLPDGLLS